MITFIATRTAMGTLGPTAIATARARRRKRRGRREDRERTSVPGREAARRRDEGTQLKGVCRIIYYTTLR